MGMVVYERESLGLAGTDGQTVILFREFQVDKLTRCAIKETSSLVKCLLMSQ